MRTKTSHAYKLTLEESKKGGESRNREGVEQVGNEGVGDIGKKDLYLGDSAESAGQLKEEFCSS